MGNIIAIDAGNTHTRFARFGANDVLPEKVVSVLTVRDYADMYYLDAVAPLLEKPVVGAILSSVVPGLTTPLSLMMQSVTGKKTVIVSAEMNLDFTIRYDNPMRLGADRIANAAAAFSIFPGKDVLVFDVGTAMTVCALYAEKRFEGGMILPGPQTALAALLEHTALPVVSLRGDMPELAAGNTEEGIRSGILWGYISMIEGLHMRYNRIHQRNFHPVLTGGAASMLDGMLGWECAYEPDLTMRGLKIIYDGNHDFKTEVLR